MRNRQKATVPAPSVAVADSSELLQTKNMLRQQTERLLGMQRVSHAILTAQTPNAVAETVITHLQEWTSCQYASVTLFDDVQHNAIEIAAYHNGRNHVFTGAASPFVPDFPHLPQPGAEVIRIDDITLANQSAFSRLLPQRYADGLRSALRFPLVVEDQCIGMLTLGSDVPYFFTDAHVALTREIGACLAIALKQTQLRAQLQTYAHTLEHTNARLQTEIHERQRTEDVFQENLRLFHAILENTSDAIFVKDLSGRYQLINATGATWVGKEVKDILGQDAHAIFPPDEAARISASDRQVLETGASVEYEGTIVLNGNTRDFWSKKNVYRDEQGHILGLIGITRDVTESKRTQVALQKSQELFDLFMSHTPAIAFIKNEAGQLHFVNPTFKQTFAFALAEKDWQGKTDAELWSAATAEQLRDNDIAILTTGQPQMVEETVEFPDGPRFWLTYKFPFRNAAGQQMLGGMGLEITDRKRTENALHALTETLEQRVEERTQALEDKHQQLLGSQERLQMLHDLDQAILSARSPEVVAQEALRHLRRLIACERLSITTFDLFQDQAVVLAREPEPDLPPRVGDCIPLHKQDIAWLQQGHIRTLQEMSTWLSSSPIPHQRKSEGLANAIFVPILAQGELLASINVWSKQATPFPEETVEIVQEVANSIAMALQQARLRDQVQHHTQELEEKVAARTAELQERQRFIEQIADTSPQILYLYDLRLRRVTYLNRQVATVLGYRAGRAPQSREETLRTFFHPDDLARELAHLRKFLTAPDGSVLETEYRMKHRTGEWRWLLDRGTVFQRDKEGRPTAILGMIQDITDRKLADEQLRASHQRLEETLAELQQTQQHVVRQERLAAVGQLAAGIAHDFNNILTAILGFAELLQMDESLSVPAQDGIKTIAEQGRRAAQLVRQILDFSRQSVNYLQPLDVGSLLQETAKLLSRTLPESIRVTVDLKTDIPWIEADPAQLQQVITNLALNARDAMPHGGELSFCLSQFTIPEDTDAPPVANLTPGQWIVLTVSDSGAGMSPAVQARIFEPFFSTKDIGKGAGLGLSQVYGIVNQHGGHIRVNSQEGQGSIFQLYFPAFTPGEQHLQHQEQVSFGHEETLLLVEDEKAVRTTLRTMLEHLHYRVVEAKNGVEAHALYVDHPEQFDLVIMDLVMPEMGGVALSRTLQQLNPSLPIILMSGYPLGEAEKSLLASGIYHWLPKPPTLQELAQIVHTLLRSPRQGQATHAIDADHQLKEAPLP